MTLTPELLVEIRRIEELKYRYLRHLDLKQWDELAGLLLPDATASYGGGAYTFDSREAIMEFLRRTMSSEQVLTSHKAHHPEIVIDGDEAHGTWALEDVVVHQVHNVTIQGAAYYHDVYRKVGQDWLIASTGYLRVYEEVFPRASISGLKITADYWATHGRSELPSS